jgi:hypothetical protein
MVTGSKFNQTSMVGPLGVVPVALIASTTEVEEDVDGYPLGGAAGSSDSSHHHS